MAQPTPQTIAAAKRAAELAADVASALTRGGPRADYREESESGYLLRIGSDDDARRQLRQAADALDALHAELAGADPSATKHPHPDVVEREAAADRVARVLEARATRSLYRGADELFVGGDAPLLVPDLVTLVRAVRS